MKFESCPGESGPVGLLAAAIRGLPPSGRGYCPAGEADLRPALYSPASDFPDLALATTMALFPGDLDPFLAESLASAAFAAAPSAFAYGEDLLVLDLASGPSGSEADYGAAFLAALLAAAPRRRRLVIAAAPPRAACGFAAAEGSALAEAFPGPAASGPLLVLLRPRGASLRGIAPRRLARKGGSCLVLDVEGGAEEAAALIAAVAGGELAGRSVTAGGPDNPARVAAGLVLHAAAFGLASRGSSGDVYPAFAPDDGYGLAAALWGWRFGLPQGGIVLAEAEGREPGVAGGAYQVERFGAENPGALRSLVRGAPASRAEAESAAAGLAAAGGPALDLASAFALAAAERALAEGLRGHARLFVGRSALPSWDAAAARADSPAEAPADASIAPEPAALASVLERLSGELGLDLETPKA